MEKITAAYIDSSLIIYATSFGYFLKLLWDKKIVGRLLSVLTLSFGYFLKLLWDKKIVGRFLSIFDVKWVYK